jgi:hypothetical protein
MGGLFFVEEANNIISIKYYVVPITITVVRLQKE